MLHPISRVPLESNNAIKSNDITNFIEALDSKAVLISDSYFTKSYVKLGIVMSGTGGNTFIVRPENGTYIYMYHSLQDVV